MGRFYRADPKAYISTFPAGKRVVLTSDAAPHHPMWHTDQAWMRRVNSRVTTA